jgi:hypothetical protein
MVRKRCFNKNSKAYLTGLSAAAEFYRFLPEVDLGILFALLEPNQK